MYIQEKVAWDGEVEQRLAALRTLGVDCVSIDLPDGQGREGAIDLSTLESAAAFFRKAKATVAAHGMELRTVLATSGFDEIKRGVTGRDQKIAFLVNVLHAMGAAGIPILAYNFKLLNSKLLRSAPTQGRGAATYITFDYDEYLRKPANPIAPPISEEKMWDNITYFLKAIIPAAEKSGVRMALHPDDPPVPRGVPPLAGAAHIASNFEQFHRIFSIVPSRSNGMLFSYSLDHSPAFPGAQIANQAFVIGYLRALIQAVYR